VEVAGALPLLHDMLGREIQRHDRNGRAAKSLAPELASRDEEKPLRWSKYIT
jgi:hypothetical protein